MRKLRIVLAALIVGVLGITGAATPATAAGPDRLPITIANQSGRGEQVFVYVQGTNLSTGKLGWVDAGGTFHQWPAGANPPSPAPDSAIAGPTNGGSVTVQVPRGFSGRIYFSFGQKLPFSLTPGGLVQPAPWAGNDPSRDILFDWSELTYDNGGLWLNSSQVDMFAVPHAVSVTGASGTTRTTGRLVAGGRQQIIDALKGDAAWARSVVTRSDGTVLRVLAPGKAASAGLLSAGFLDSYIASAWNAYSSRNLTVQPFGDRPEVRYTGRTSGTTMRFTDSSGREVASFNRPSSADVWGCDGALHAPNDQVVGPIARTLCSALFRGTLGASTTEPVSDAGQYYRSTPPNLYGRVIHAAMADGRAYAFPFDDVGAHESLVHDGDPRSARIELHLVHGRWGHDADADADHRDGRDPFRLGRQVPRRRRGEGRQRDCRAALRLQRYERAALDLRLRRNAPRARQVPRREGLGHQQRLEAADLGVPPGPVEPDVGPLGELLQEPRVRQVHRQPGRQGRQQPAHPDLGLLRQHRPAVVAAGRLTRPARPADGPSPAPAGGGPSPSRPALSAPRAAGRARSSRRSGRGVPGSPRRSRPAGPPARA